MSFSAWTVADPHPGHQFLFLFFKISCINCIKKSFNVYYSYYFYLGLIKWSWTFVNGPKFLNIFSQLFRARLVHVFKNWKLLFENICGNTCGWKSALKCVKCCLKIENSCLKSQTKHPPKHCTQISPPEF